MNLHDYRADSEIVALGFAELREFSELPEVTALIDALAAVCVPYIADHEVEYHVGHFDGEADVAVIVEALEALR